MTAVLKLVTPATNVHPRLIMTQYSARNKGRKTRSSSLEGALRAAIIRVVHGEYAEAWIYDERFGTSSLAVYVKRTNREVLISWLKTPKWKDPR